MTLEIKNTLAKLGVHITEAGDCWIPSDVSLPPEIEAQLSLQIQPPSISPNLFESIEPPRIFSHQTHD